MEYPSGGLEERRFRGDISPCWSFTWKSAKSRRLVKNVIRIARQSRKQCGNAHCFKLNCKLSYFNFFKVHILYMDLVSPSCKPFFRFYAPSTAGSYGFSGKQEPAWNLFFRSKKSLSTNGKTSLWNLRAFHGLCKNQEALRQDRKPAHCNNKKRM